MLQEFKDFISKGSVVDLAIGLIMGAAFGAVVKSFVSDIVMPFVGLFTGGVSFTSLYANLSGTAYDTLAAAEEAGAAVVAYGRFIDNIITFLITAFVIFLVVRAYNNMKKKEEAVEAAPAGPSTEEVLLGEIRDLLKK